MSDKMISVIIPIYNSEKYLDECVQSVVNQTYDNLEIILVDDGSPDNCPAMCDSWKKRDDRIRVIHKENGGLSDARNAGIRLANGEWLLFIDSDDVIPKQFVESLVLALTDSKRLVVSDKVRFFDELPQHEEIKVLFQSCGKDLVAKRGGMYCWGALYSRELVSQISLWFDSSLGNIEDVVWNGIYLMFISEVIWVNVPYYYRMNPTSITSKCGDHKWQIASWIAARKSIMNWFVDKSLTDSQKREALKMFRHCQNNIYAECISGNISFTSLQAMEKKVTAQFSEDLVSYPERYIRKHFPRGYYGMYTFLLRMRNILRK